MTPASRSSEEGFVLIAAIWLLVLAGSIAALLMLQGMTASRQARAEGDILRTRLALAAAVETVVADRIMNGGRSIWSQAPAEGVIDIDGVAVRVRSTSEADRVDLLRADPRLIDATLRSAGLTAEQREAIMGRAVMQQAGGGQSASLASMKAILDGSTSATAGPCLAELFTPFPGGRTTQSAGTIGQDAGIPRAEPLRAGTIQRLELTAPQGAALIVLLRVTAQRGNAASHLDWQNHRLCLD